jgi:hypothetical protein
MTERADYSKFGLTCPRQQVMNYFDLKQFGAQLSTDWPIWRLAMPRRGLGITYL